MRGRRVALLAHPAELGDDIGDVWEGLFELARQNGNGRDRGLSPYWVYPVDGGAFIERHVPCLPLFRDGLHLENLRRSLAVYRMVFGQPRQDDVMAYLLERVGPEVLEEKRSLLRINLAPPARPTHPVEGNHAGAKAQSQKVNEALTAANVVRP